MCSTCTEGHEGPDCSFIVQDIPPDRKTMACSVSPGKTTNFLGYTFSVSQPKSYYMIKTQHLSFWVGVMSSLSFLYLIYLNSVYQVVREQVELYTHMDSSR